MVSRGQRAAREGESRVVVGRANLAEQRLAETVLTLRRVRRADCEHAHLVKGPVADATRDDDRATAPGSALNRTSTRRSGVGEGDRSVAEGAC